MPDSTTALELSEGVRAEIHIAAELGKPVRYLDPDWSPTLAHDATEAEA